MREVLAVHDGRGVYDERNVHQVCFSSRSKTREHVEIFRLVCVRAAFDACMQKDHSLLAGEGKGRALLLCIESMHGEDGVAIDINKVVLDLFRPLATRVLDQSEARANHAALRQAAAGHAGPERLRICCTHEVAGLSFSVSLATFPVCFLLLSTPPGGALPPPLPMTS